MDKTGNRPPAGGYRDVRDLPVYRAALNLNQGVNRFAVRKYEARAGSAEVDALHRKAVLIAARIAGGHAFGYGEDLAENLGLCRQARDTSRECEQPINLLFRDEAARAELAHLQDLLFEMRVELEKWIRELEELLCA